MQLGSLKRDLAEKLAPLIDADGRRYTAEVTAVTGGGNGRSFGVNIRVKRTDVVRARARAAKTSGPPRHDEVVRALIGAHPLRESQSLVVERIEDGRNTLAVMGTGRGKSFCFQYPSAIRALERGAKTLVIYPLRALANDQFLALEPDSAISAFECFAQTARSMGRTGRADGGARERRVGYRLFDA